MNQRELYLIPQGGFGNRMWSYETAYQINKNSGYNSKIIMDEKYFPEVKYLDFPYVEQGKLIKKSVTRVKYDDNIRCDYKVEDPVTLKDKELEQDIKNRMKDVIGVHIRRGDVVDELNPNHPSHGIQPIIPNDYYRKTMNKYKDKKFYISTDCKWNQVKWLWDEYNIINKWKKVKEPMGHYFPFTKVEALDLFHLIHSEIFIMGLSSWSEWVSVQRRHSNCIVPPINFEKVK